MDILNYAANTDLVKASNNIALSYMKKEIPALLKQEYGENWMDAFVHPIMEKYPFNDRKVYVGDDPLSSLDLTAMWFLLFPYERSGDKEEIVHLSGAGDLLKERKNLTEQQSRKLSAIRTLRNSFDHNDPTIMFIRSEHQSDFREEKRDVIENSKEKTKSILVYNGNDILDAQVILHMDAIDFIADAMRPLDPAAPLKAEEEKKSVLAEIKKQLQDSGAVTEASLRMQNYRESIYESRKLYGRKRTYPWNEAPIGEPLQTPVPWAHLNFDLEWLPWPTEKIEKEKNERLEKAIENQDEGALTGLIKGINRMFNGN